MTRLKFGEAIDRAVAHAMGKDERIVVFGEDVPMLRGPLAARFGASRVMGAPISESAFVGAAIGAAMAGLKPIVELMMADFAGVCFDAFLNEMSKLRDFSGGKWTCPLVVRAPCGGGYGDGGQHQQALWGLFAGIPGLTVVVPSTPADAAGLMTAALAHDGPVVFLEHKLLSESWLSFLGRGGREDLEFDVPPEGAEGEVPDGFAPVEIGRAATRREGDDLTLVSLGVGVHRAMAAATGLEARGLSSEVIDLRSVRPLDRAAIASSAARTGRVLVVDEDYREAGLSGEIAAALLEARLAPLFARVCVEGTLPYDRRREALALPNVARISATALEMLGTRPLARAPAATI